MVRPYAIDLILSILIIVIANSIFWDLYIAIIYGILYLEFVAYPIVFSQIRGWSPGISGLSFTGLCVGCFIVIGLEPLLRRMTFAHKKDPETGKVPPEAMVSIVCIAAVLVPIGELWFAWTCVPPVHWVWPILAGIPFGSGTTGVFIYASNYLAQSYGSKRLSICPTLLTIIKLIKWQSLFRIRHGRQRSYQILTRWDSPARRAEVV